MHLKIITVEYKLKVTE